MTTTVTVKTHGRPAAVGVNSQFSHSTPTSCGWGHSSATEFVGPNEERTFTVTDTQSIDVRELPEGTTSLEAPDDCDSVVSASVG